MTELRQNLATREWAIIATERARRPEQFVQPPKERVEDRPAWVEGCPFCPGNEELDLERMRLPDDGDWQARVVGNRYPALQQEGDRTRRFEGFNCAISGVGYHEVVIESRLHNTCPALESVAFARGRRRRGATSTTRACAFTAGCARKRSARDRGS